MFDPNDEKAIELRAVSLLSRREHSQAELQRKLVQRGFAAAVCERVIQGLAARNWQSDARFIESFIRHRIAQQQGPIKISFELGQRGIRNDLVQASLAQVELDWHELAADALQRRFQTNVAAAVANGKRNARDNETESKQEKTDWAERSKEIARRQRFLASRGFTMEQIRSAMDALESGTES